MTMEEDRQVLSDNAYRNGSTRSKNSRRLKKATNQVVLTLPTTLEQVPSNAIIFSLKQSAQWKGPNLYTSARDGFRCIQVAHGLQSNELETFAAERKQKGVRS